MNEKYVPYGKQQISDEDVAAVVSVLRSDFLTQGPAVERFEKAVKEASDANFAIAVNSATSALHIACLALGVKKGDLVWTSPISFVASSNCALYCEADVDFVDIDPTTFNMSVLALSEKLQQAQKEGRLPKVVIPVHLCGQSCPMEEISRLAKEYNFSVIEDASHAIGGRYQNMPVGNCAYSDITVFSFHPVKIVTTAEGGCLTTNNPDLANSLLLLRSHGITRDEAQMRNEPDGSWYYEQIDLGYNYRMTELQAALGCSQMNELHNFVARRHELADRYDALLASLPVDTPQRHPDVYSGLHLYVIQLRLNEINKTHRAVFEELRCKNIGVNLHYIPIHTQPYYRDLGFKPGQFPRAEEYYSRSISIPLFHAMTDEQQDQVVETLKEVVS